MENLNYNFRNITENDYEFIYQIKKNTYKKYVEANWGLWDENAQREYFKKFIETYNDNIFIIQIAGKDIGFYNGEMLENGNYEVGNICIIPEYQGKGLGTQILKDIIEKYKEYDIEIQYFKQNPVGKLYERLGFIPNGETDFHYQMVKPVIKQKFNVMLRSENIDYVEITTELIYDYLKMVNNPNINKLISGKEKFYSYEDEINWINNKLEEKAIIFSMIERTTGKFIGNVEFMHVTEKDAEIGISITEDYQNKHYGTETLKTMIDFGFNKLGLEEINLIVFSHNLRAIHCYKKLGFIEYKVVENVRIVDGESINDIYMKLKK